MGGGQVARSETGIMYFQKPSDASTGWRARPCQRILGCLSSYAQIFQNHSDGIETILDVSERSSNIPNAPKSHYFLDHLVGLECHYITQCPPSQHTTSHALPLPIMPCDLPTQSPSPLPRLPRKCWSKLTKVSKHDWWSWQLWQDMMGRSK